VRPGGAAPRRGAWPFDGTLGCGPAVQVRSTLRQLGLWQEDGVGQFFEQTRIRGWTPRCIP